MKYCASHILVLQATKSDAKTIAAAARNLFEVFQASALFTFPS
jgi:hypothetical protein